jgi:hypothetical protein
MKRSAFSCKSLIPDSFSFLGSSKTKFKHVNLNKSKKSHARHLTPSVLPT